MTQDELREFNQYATEKLRAGRVDSLEELLHEWRLVRDRDDANAAFRRGNADIGSRPLDEFWDEFTAQQDTSRDA